VDGTWLTRAELLEELERARASIAHVEEDQWRSQERLISGVATHLHDGLLVMSPEGVILDVNSAFCAMTGFAREELLGHGLPQPYSPPEEHRTNLDAFSRLDQSPTHAFELVFMRRGGERFPVLISPTVLRDAAGARICLVATVKDMTHRRQAAWEAERTMEFLGLLNESFTSEALIKSAVGFLREHSRCDAVGVRVREGLDYPYFETSGFSPRFVQLENSLCARDKGGDILLDDAGDPVLDCMCGNVIRGRFDPSQPFFTERGSFWSNGTSKMLARTTDEDRLTHTRNRCNGDGYESVLLMPLRAGGEPLGLLQMNARRVDAFSASEVALWERLAGYLAVGLAKVRAEEHQHDLVLKLEHSLRATVSVLGTTVELRDPYTAGHQRRVTELAEAIARRAGWDEEQVTALTIAAQVHDLGKMAVPVEILSKPTRLSHDEFAIIKEHSETGFEILRAVDFGLPVAEIVRQHHERIDGSGYPRGLQGDEILPEARVLGVADVVEAMISNRPYRPALSLDLALEEIREGSGLRYDAEAAEICRQLMLGGFEFAGTE
jgi:PAS domain S-box-containing protein/putative nucleotidyltransferase with HDIG domain